VRDPRESSFAVPLSAVGLLLAALFLALFPLVPGPWAPTRSCPTPPRVGLLKRRQLEREQRLFLERLERDLEKLEIATEKFVRCCERNSGGVLKDDDPPDPRPDDHVDARGDGAGAEAGEPLRDLDSGAPD
jgi:hypothetical protein